MVAAPRGPAAWLRRWMAAVVCSRFPGMRAPLCVVALLSLGLLTGCPPFGPEACPLSIEPAVTVAVVDATTGASRNAGARGAVHDGPFVDSLRIVRWAGDGTALLLGAADARPGTYTVTVTHPGYQPWTQAGVRTRSDGCAARAPELRAALVPVS